jgi:hypothetical protein
MQPTPPGERPLREKLSAVVVAYNRAPLIGTCLRALAFADEVIVVDKSSTDDTRAVAARYADRVITVPWSPTVEETRAFAVAQCAHDWIVYVDDDECLSTEAIHFIQTELTAPSADIYGLLQRHYILGTHDEAAYYWPEHQIRLFRRGTVAFNGTVHDGIVLYSDRVLRVAPESRVAIHHLSHRDVAQWVEKTNRYTSRPDRHRVADDGQSLARFAHARIDHWLSLTRDVSPGGYPEAVAVLRATYDLIDRLKVWEEERGLDGAVLFQRACAALDAGYATLGFVRDRAGETVTIPPSPPVVRDEHDFLRKRLVEFRRRHDALMVERDAHALEAVRLAGDLSVLAMARDEVLRALDEVQRALGETRQQLNETSQALAQTQLALEAQRYRAEQAEAMFASAQAAADAERQRADAERQRADAERQRADAIEASAFWRATAIPRRLVHRLKLLVRRRAGVA